MTCLECGNCQKAERVFFCPARNEFIIKEETVVKEKSSQWKKGAPDYEDHRRRLRKEREDLRIIS